MRKRKGAAKKLTMIFLLMVCIFFYGRTEASAASTAKYSTVKNDRSQTYGSMKASVYYTRVTLKGNSSAVRKINNSLRSDMNKFLNSSGVANLYDYADNAASTGASETYAYYATSKVTYNKKNIISIRVRTFWFAGGVVNTDLYGLTYDLKTGKKLNLVNVCSGNAAAVKNRVLSKIRSDKESSTMSWSALQSYSAKKMDFYLNAKGKAVVCFGPYEINYGGWYRTFTISSKFG